MLLLILSFLKNCNFKLDDENKIIFCEETDENAIHFMKQWFEQPNQVIMYSVEFQGKQYELLPYHPLGNSKRKALGMDEDKFSIPSAEYMKEIEKYVFIR